MRVPIIRKFLRTLSLYGLIPYFIWKGIPAIWEFKVFTKKGFFYYNSSLGDGIGHRLFWKGLIYWENQTNKLIGRLAEIKHKFLDIGANTGTYSLLSTHHNNNLSSVALEPVPRVFEKAKKNILINEFEKSISLLPYAISNFDGMTKLHVPYSPVPASSSLNTAGFRGFEGELIDVECFKADTLCKRLNYMPDFVKIDVEGFEHHVLEGMGKILENSKPVIICECNDDGPLKEIEKIIKSHDYNIYEIGKEITKTNHIIGDKLRIHRNYLFIHENDLETISFLKREEFLL